MSGENDRAHDYRHFHDSQRLVGGTRVELGEIKFPDGTPRTLRVRPTHRSLPDPQTSPYGERHWYIRLEVIETLGPREMTRIVHVPWTGAAVLLGGRDAKVFATLIAEPFTSELAPGSPLPQQWCSVELGVRDGSPMPFDTPASIHITEDFSFGGRPVAIPSFATHFTPMWSSHVDAFGFTFRDSGGNNLNGETSLSSYQPVPVAILPGAAQLLLFVAGTAPVNGAVIGLQFHGRI